MAETRPQREQLTPAGLPLLTEQQAQDPQVLGERLRITEGVLLDTQAQLAQTKAQLAAANAQIEAHHAHPLGHVADEAILGTATWEFARALFRHRRHVRKQKAQAAQERALAYQQRYLHGDEYTAMLRGLHTASMHHIPGATLIARGIDHVAQYEREALKPHAPYGSPVDENGYRYDFEILPIGSKKKLIEVSMPDGLSIKPIVKNDLLNRYLVGVQEGKRLTRIGEYYVDEISARGPHASDIREVRVDRVYLNEDNTFAMASLQVATQDDIKRVRLYEDPAAMVQDNIWDVINAYAFNPASVPETLKLSFNGRELRLSHVTYAALRDMWRNGLVENIGRQIEAIPDLYENRGFIAVDLGRNPLHENTNPNLIPLHGNVPSQRDEHGTFPGFAGVYGYAVQPEQIRTALAETVEKGDNIVEINGHRVLIVDSELRRLMGNSVAITNKFLQDSSLLRLTQRVNESKPGEPIVLDMRPYQRFGRVHGNPLVR